MNTRKVMIYISKAQLLNALYNTYEDATFFVGIGMEIGKSFSEGLFCYKSYRYSKSELLKIIEESCCDEFHTIPEHKDSLIIRESLFVYLWDIDYAQRYPVPSDVDGFTHIVCQYNQHYDIYYKIDRHKQTITFALGELKRTMPLISHTEWVWKLRSDALLCSDIEHLDKTMQDPFWSNVVVKIGRKALKIKAVF